MFDPYANAARAPQFEACSNSDKRMDRHPPKPPTQPSGNTSSKKSLVPLRDMLVQTGIRRSTWYLKHKKGEDVPLPVRLFGARMVRFEQTEIDAWIERRLAERRDRRL
ncbi:MAG: hypothetical protein DI563_00095 [Variovorax paradoxus]|uniref:AlpA family phage regulatory protein n=1 Tax=Variovorax paradoxus TaxID=34073 RepID=A0A2W5S6L9_VARPD|nr:MAG: hypothetical protein DI563_00095 [Variovorax paradoxus]